MWIGADVDLAVQPVELASGGRLTEATVDDLVAAAHALRGRPSLTAPGHRSPAITLRLPQSLLDRLDTEAAHTGTPRSVILRAALEEHLNHSA